MTQLGLEDLATIRDVAEELRGVLDLLDDQAHACALAESQSKKAYLVAHAESTTLHPERKVDEHKVAAESASFDEWSRFNTAQYGLRALKERAHSLRQILSSYQTTARVEAQAGGLG